MEAIVFIIIQRCFLQHTQFWKLGNITQIFPSFSWGIFSHMMRYTNHVRAKYDGLKTVVLYSKISNIIKRCMKSTILLLACNKKVPTYILLGSICLYACAPHEPQKL